MHNFLLVWWGFFWFFKERWCQNWCPPEIIVINTLIQGEKVLILPVLSFPPLLCRNIFFGGLFFYRQPDRSRWQFWSSYSAVGAITFWCCASADNNCKHLLCFLFMQFLQAEPWECILVCLHKQPSGVCRAVNFIFFFSFLFVFLF